jgi:acylphosphatase
MYALQNKALELGVTGWVRNRRDGRVEVTAEGYADDLEALLKWLHTGASFGALACPSSLGGVVGGGLALAGALAG